MNYPPVKLTFDESFFQPEIRCDHLIPDWMKQVWAVELDLLDQFQRLCSEHGITYYASSGTLLGAVRHKGFIPWDDDIDVAVPRKDYDRLCMIAPSFFKDPYFFQTEATDHGFAHPFARLRNSLTTAIPLYDSKSKLKYNQGIWIDIFPLDNIPNDEKIKNGWKNKIAALHKRIWLLGRFSTRYRTPFDRETVLKKSRYLSGPILKILMERFHLPNVFYNQYEELVRAFCDEETDEWGLIWFSDNNEKRCWKKEWFAEVLSVPFENLEIIIPAGYEEILNRRYGDWSVFVKGSAVHYDTVFDVNKPYDYYYHHPNDLKLLSMKQENVK